MGDFAFAASDAKIIATKFDKDFPNATPTKEIPHRQVSTSVEAAVQGVLKALAGNPTARVEIDGKFKPAINSLADWENKDAGVAFGIATTAFRALEAGLQAVLASVDANAPNDAQVAKRELIGTLLAVRDTVSSETEFAESANPNLSRELWALYRISDMPANPLSNTDKPLTDLWKEKNNLSDTYRTQNPDSPLATGFSAVNEALGQLDALRTSHVTADSLSTAIGGLLAGMTEMNGDPAVQSNNQTASGLQVVFRSIVGEARVVAQNVAPKAFLGAAPRPTLVTSIGTPSISSPQLASHRWNIKDEDISDLVDELAREQLEAESKGESFEESP